MITYHGTGDGWRREEGREVRSKGGREGGIRGEEGRKTVCMTSRGWDRLQQFCRFLLTACFILAIPSCHAVNKVVKEMLHCMEALRGSHRTCQ